MIEGLPIYVSIFFALTVVATIAWMYAATRSKPFLVLMIGYTALQSVLAYKGLYNQTDIMPPPPLVFGVAPTMVMMALVFLTKRGRLFMDKANLKTLTYSHSVRIPVEIILALLFHYGFVSQYMTFEGTNFDIFSGLTAGLIGWLAFRNTQINKRLLLGWNLLCLTLLLNVVITAAFATPSPMQQIAFDQPNVAVLYLPFNLLPSVIVPLVLFAHLIAIRALVKK